MIHQFKLGARLPKEMDAQACWEFINALSAAHGTLAKSPEIVRAARDPASPIHRAFEWDDKIAADQHRLQQACRLVDSIMVVDPDHPEVPPHHAFVNITLSTGEGTERGYVPVQIMLADPAMREQHLFNVLRDTEAQLSRFSDFEGIEALKVRVERERQRVKKRIERIHKSAREAEPAAPLPA
jgi:hypothetical protein